MCGCGSALVIHPPEGRRSRMRCYDCGNERWVRNG
jgi:hypothetical protein